MRKFIFLLLLHLLVVNNPLLKGQWVRLNGPAGSTVNSFAINENRIYSGTIGGIYLSTDNGSNWVQLKSGLPDNTAFISLAAKDSLIFAGTYGKGIYRSTDKGANWYSLDVGMPLKYAWVNALVFSGNNIFAGIYDGKLGRVYLSEDNGSSWKSVSNGLPDGIFIKALAVGRNSRIFAATSNGIYLSTDNGSNWAHITDTILTGAFICFAVSGDTVYAGSGSGGKGVFRSTNNGKNWELTNSGIAESHITSLAVKNNYVFAGTLSRGIYISKDYGKLWKSSNSGLSDQNILTISVSENRIFAGSGGDGVFLSEDNGENWNSANNGMRNSSVYSLFMGNNILYAGTGKGVFSSTDNGKSWSSGNNGIADLPVKAFAQSKNGIFALTEKSIYRSTDNGLNWFAVNNGLPSTNFNSIIVVDSHIFAGTDNGVFLSTDEGKNWKIVNKGMYSMILSDSILRITSLSSLGNKVFAGSAGREDAGRLFMSTNFGENWITLLSGTASRFDVVSLAVAANRLYVSFTQGSMYDQFVVYSADSGKTWNWAYDGFPQHTDVYNFFVIGNNIYSESSAGIFLFNSDSSKWIDAETSFPDKLSSYNYDKLSSVVYNSNYVFASTLDSGIWRCPLSEIVNDVNTKHIDPPGHYSLRQNYPNPFNPLTTIIYTLPCASYVELKLFDILGRTIVTLIDKEQNAGEHKIILDGSKLPSGIYIYSIRAGQFKDSKKLLLLK